MADTPTVFYCRWSLDTAMTKLSTCLMIFAILHSSYGVSTKIDFDDESATVTNSSKAEDDDVEVKHTIVVSTKLKNANGNRRGLHRNDGDSRGILSYNIGRKEMTNKDDSGEVPIVLGYKAVETTQIRTPDTRVKQLAPSYPESVFISRNIRDDYDVYPNLAASPAQWKPSSYFNNINYRNSDHSRDSNFVRRFDRPAYLPPGKIHRKLPDDGMKEFYCRKCRELSGKCAPQNVAPYSWVETTTTMKIDGKLAKLN